MIVNPPGKPSPLGNRVSVDEPGQDDAGGGAHVPVSVAPVPDMPGIVRFVARAVVSMTIAVLVDGTVAKSRSQADASERRLQRLKQVLAEAAAGGDRQVRIVRQVRNAAHDGNLGMQEFAHEEIGRQAHPPQLLERPDCLRPAHGGSPRHERSH